MTAQPGKYQANFNSGEIGPEMHGRVDLKQYYSSAAYMRNVEPVPQGGFKLTPRTEHAGFGRNRLQAIGVASYVTNLGPHSAAATLATATFTAVARLAVASLSGFTASQALSGLIRLEYLDQDGVTWLPVAPTSAGFNAGTAPRGRVAARAPGDMVWALAVRVRLTGAPPSATTFTMPDLDVFSELNEIPAGAVVRAFTFSKTQVYELVITDGLIDIWREDTFVGAVATSYAGAAIRELDLQQRFDTMLIFHDDFTPLRLLRDGADHEWDLGVAEFTGMPQVDYGGSYATVTDVWELMVSFPTTGTSISLHGKNIHLAITVGGEACPSVFMPDDGGGDLDVPAFEANLIAAIEGLAGVDAGIAASCNYQKTQGIAITTITFSGGDNPGNEFTVTARVSNVSDAAAFTTHVTVGDPGGEDVMSDTRGWPGCGLFWQDRLGYGGFRSKQGAFLFSRTGEYFDLDIKATDAAGAILANLDTDGAERIVRLARSLHLVLFTTDGEYFIVDRALSRTQTPNTVEASRNGIVPTIPVCKAEDALFYVAADKSDDEQKGVLVYAMQYSDALQRYVSDPISLLASHIAQDIVDAAMQVFSKPSAASRYLLVREDGALAIGVMIRGQDITGFIRWETDGAVRSACVNGKNVPYLLVERTVDGAQRLTFERMSSDVFLDGAVTVTNTPAAAIVSGLDMHEGAQVWAVADGYVLGPFTVTGGQIDLSAVDPEMTAETIVVGRWTAPRGLTLPIPRIVQDTTVVARPVRVHTVRGNLIGTTSLAIGANDNPPEDVPFFRAGQPADVPRPPYSGEFEVGGLQDYTATGTVEITQLKPGWLQVRELIVEARV